MISTIGNLSSSAEQWTAGGMPLTHMMNIERRAGKEKPVIKKALTELDGKPFLTFAGKRSSWKLTDCYRSPGPIQFDGPGSENISITPKASKLPPVNNKKTGIKVVMSFLILSAFR